MSESWIERVKSEMTELPAAKRERYQGDYGLSAYDAAQLTQSRETAAFFEDMVQRLGADAAKQCANWVTVELAGALNRDGLDIAQTPVSSALLAALVSRVRDNTLSGKMAKDVFDALWKGEGGSEGAVDAIIASRGMKQISDTGELEGIVESVIVANPKSVEEFRAGKEKALNALVGQAMKATKGKGNPAVLNEIFRKKLGA